MLYSVMSFDPGGTELMLEGTPDELKPLVKGGDSEFDVVAGYYVTRTAPGAHDGRPATVITLADEEGDREAGRFVIRHDATHDQMLAWLRVFRTVEAADRFSEAFHSRKTRPKVSTVGLDLAYKADTVEEEIANLSAEYGVSGRVEQERGPADGWPVVQWTGLTENVEKLLRVGYELDDDDVKELLDN